MTVLRLPTHPSAPAPLTISRSDFSPKVFGKNNYGWFTDEVIKFGHTNRTLENLQSMSYCYLASYVGPHIDFGWNPFANTFRHI